MSKSSIFGVAFWNWAMKMEMRAAADEHQTCEYYFWGRMLTCPTNTLEYKGTRL